MNYIANKLEDLDGYFEQKSTAEKWTMIALFAGVVAFLAYDYFYDDAKKFHDRSIQHGKELTKKINEEEVYLRSISKNGDREFKVKQYDIKIESQKQLITMEKKKIVVIDDNLAKLSDLLFNRKNWSLFLDSITEGASVNSIKIDSLSNKYVDDNHSFGHVLEINIKCEGDFGDMANFINDLEQNTLVTDVYSSRIYTDLNRSAILSDINISVWGVNR